ncbi:hypothetical protein BH11CYA1_BH11CYA1_08480 [soil metagenome]
MKNCFLTALAIIVASATSASAAETPYELGLQSYKKGDYVKASTYFEEALKKTQQDPWLWYYDALSFHQLKNWPMAKSRYKTIAQYFPTTEVGKRAVAALKGIDPTYVPPQTASATSATTPESAAGASTKSSVAAAGTKGASQTSKPNDDDDDDDKPLELAAKAALAKELASLPDTAHFYFKKGANGHMEVDLMVNGHPVKALFDTGATAFFYRDQLKEAGLDLNNAKAGRGARGWAGVAVATSVIPAEVKLGTLTRNLNITMQESVTTGHFAQNLIGQDLVRGYQYEIDDKGCRVDLKKTLAIKTSDINPMYDIPLTKKGKDDYIAFSINSQKAEAFIDTGASNTIIGVSDAARMGIQGSGEQMRMSGVGGSITMERAYVTIRIGGMMREGFPILIGGHAGCALGQDLMEGWRYKVDREHNLLRFYH